VKHPRLSRYWIAIMAAAIVAACTKLDLGGGGGGPIPTPTASSTLTPAPGACSTPNIDANTVIVAMGNEIAPTTAPKYKTINGYAVVESGSFSGKAMLINQWENQGVISPITSNNLLQFANVDTGGALHSAVGFKGNRFPPIPYTFPSAAASPVATAVSTGTLWSTGRINPPIYQQCYSQTFTLKPGVYYFGDLDYYNLSNFRDVLIVATPQAKARSRH
jgi:hypothetical protein